MFIRDLYDNVITTTPITQPKFFTYLDTTVRSLQTKFKERFVFVEPAYIKPRRLDCEIPVYDEYFNSLADNILFLATKDQFYKQEFENDSVLAYKTVWKKVAKDIKMYSVEDYYSDYDSWRR